MSIEDGQNLGRKDTVKKYEAGQDIQITRKEEG